MEAINQGLVLLTMGMGTVFGFLVLLIMVMKVSSGIVVKYFPEEEKKSAPLKKDTGADVAVAIAVAKARMEGGQ